MMQTAGLRIYLLGPMRIEVDGVRIHLPRRKVESLLAYLLLHPEQHARDQLATLFWGDSTDAQARHSLRTALATLRQLVSPHLLHTDRDHVQLNATFPFWCDLHELLDVEADVAAQNSDLLRAHLSLWQGEFLTGLYDDWIANEREHYHTRLLKHFLQVTESLRGHSEYARAIEVGQHILRLDPANEHAHQHLMFCYVASGDRPAALRQYELCERALEQELDASPLPETTALYHWIKQHDPQESSNAARITNLPIPPNNFIGRKGETAEIKRLLYPGAGVPNLAHRNGTSEVRLLTLTGAGGSGKTRLAIQTATDLIDSFAHGVWWVELAALTDRDLVARSVAKTLDVREVPDQSHADTLARAIGDRQLLLALDNCEHLVAPCAHLAAHLLAHCPNLKILATSREAFNIGGEMLWHVPTFAVPHPSQVNLIELLLEYESLRLFVERAAAAQPGFALTPENARAVVEICHQLDGIPLAIELAAARIKVLSLEQIATYLTRALGARFALLTQGSRAAMPRHQTLRATMDWSYDLLDEAERTLFRKVAVFRGGFTLDALEEIVNAGAKLMPIPTTLDLLTQLVDKSLVIVEPLIGGQVAEQNHQKRYRMLETLREYALEHFPRPSELQELEQQHAHYFLHLAEQAQPAMLGAQLQTWLNRLEVEHANLRAALDALVRVADGERALRLASALRQFWEIRGYVSEGRQWLQKVLAHRDCAPLVVQASALNAAGGLAYRQGDIDEAQTLHTEALHLFEHVEDEYGIADSLRVLAAIDMEHGDYTSAQHRLEQSLALCRALNDTRGVALCLSRLGSLAWDQDRFADSSAYHRESLAMNQQLGNLVSIAFESLAVGDNERMLNNIEAAREYYEKCLHLARNLGHKGLVGAALKSLGMLAFREADYEASHLFNEQALQIFREQGDKPHIGFSLCNLGDVARKRGDPHQALVYYGQYLQIMFEVGYKWPTFYALEDIAELLAENAQHQETAVRLMGAADTLRQSTGIAVAPHFQARYEQMSTTLCQHFGDDGFALLWQTGQKTPLAEIVNEATGLTFS